MKLELLKLKNFRGYGSEVSIPINDLTAFIGRNDAGKSTILEALEIFFNNSLVKCEKDDLNINADNNLIEITCIFSDLPDQLIIDAAFPTSLADEYLLNSQQKLEIKKVYSATAAFPKEKVYIICVHPTADSAKDLLTLKRRELRERANQIGLNEDAYNANVNASMRQVIRNSFKINLKFSYTLS